VAQRELRVRLREQARATEGLGAPTSDARTPTPPLASVIVVCRDAGDVLGRCLEHLLAQDYPAVEIIVVDDASGDDTVAVAQAKASDGQLTVVRSPRHRGCPNARNIGVRHANGAIIAFIDADGFATPSWLSELVRMFASDPEIGAVASAVFYDDNPLVLNGAGGTVNRQGWAADLAMNESYEVAQIAAEALYPMGCGMAIRREALVRVGPFDDRMLNYYDDVDYGIRVWRAGYRVAVAADAWVEHGAMRGNSERKRLLCERHRMRVVLKHAPRATLREWATNELMSLWHAPRAVRARKLKAAAWNLQRFPSLLADRRLQRCSAPAPTRLIDSSWGDAFPAGITERADPRPELARDAVAIDDAGSDAQLVHGWFPREVAAAGSRRWATTYAAAIVRLGATVCRLRIDYAHVPVDIGGIELAIRRIGSPDPGEVVWDTCLQWQYTARSVENHALELAAGDYEVVFEASRGWSNPPEDTRSLAFALSSLRFTTLEGIRPGGLDMASEAVEDQLAGGWFEAEEDQGRSYRWAGSRGAVLIRLNEPVERARFLYRTPPGGGGVTVMIAPLGDAEQATCSHDLPPAPDDWCEATIDLSLAPGDYLVSLSAERSWSNPEGRDPALWPEKRTLGFALSTIGFSGGCGSSLGSAT
jgi:GT2 family glycosyltransferase